MTSPANPNPLLAEAEKEKAQGNKFFQQQLYNPAVEHYTLAIRATPEGNDKFLAILYTNRAFAHFKMENFGLVEADTTKAIELDQTYAKAYYRRASAAMILEHWDKAIKDLKEVIRLNPKDKNAREKFEQATKAKRAKAFADAISMDHEKKSVLDNLDLNSMAIESDYSGPKLVPDETGTLKITEDFVNEVAEHFRAQKLLPRRYVFEILKQALALFSAQPNVVSIPMEGESPRITVCGDVHGQYYDLLNIFNLNGKPSETNRYLFNGDFVDRGSFSCEVVLLLLSYKLLYPNSFFMARGNHETKNMNKVYGFEGETKHKYGDTVMDLFSEVFNSLPLGHIIGEKVFVVHGGLFSTDGVKISQLQTFDRFREPPETGLMAEMLWSDPQVSPGRGPSKRGVGNSFGPDVTERFLADNKLELVIRSHEVKDKGYLVEHDGKLITVFSAPNYCDQVGNLGAYIVLGKDLKPNCVSFSHVPHPNVPPMAYASSIWGM